MEDISVLRIVVRNGFSRDLATLLVRDVRVETERLAELHAATITAPAPKHKRTSFSH
jgi:hypothetical protein